MHCLHSTTLKSAFSRLKLLPGRWCHRFFSRSLSSASSKSSAWHRPDASAAAAVSVDEARRTLSVTWPSSAQGSTASHWEAASLFPLAWLRDSCQCPTCFNPATKSRTLHFKDFNPRVPVRSASVSPDSSTLTVEWQDGHRSSYSRQWLQVRSFTESARRRRGEALAFTARKKQWSQELTEFDYSELMSKDSVLLELLHHLDCFGCLLVRQSPTELGTLPKFGQRLAGFLAPSNYGHSFEVKSKSDPSNAAYTSGYLGLHIDQSFYSRRPGVQILHCISQPTDGSIQGGESLIADGFQAAAIMRRSHPDHFQALTTLPIDFNDYGSDFVGDFHFINRETVLRLNSIGEVDRVTFSGHSRDYNQNHLEPEKVQLLYEALKIFYETLSKPPCIIKHKMQTGHMQLLDNRRVLHGRLAFNVIGTAERFLHGGYVEWDEVYSRMRRLEEAARGDAREAQ
ncbi:hypothetical protein BOX15_Mlig006675g3 [Macrostomum lignano]|uniref:Gamma-butyrobetaine dioxygenase n=1 Tax=Macrostomum lignano TaxID=282301 RepID=A0A267E596_9PLAT|nr:hypothetical protein BOX15_Mlig006675g3 [Macrostomum lignano]